MNDTGNGFYYQSVKDATEHLGKHKLNIIKILMEIGNAICMSEDVFSKAYSTKTQATFLKSVKFMKTEGRKKKEKLLREYGILPPKEEGKKLNQF